jgi:nucleotide-binding universal stress UspA family protein
VLTTAFERARAVGAPLAAVHGWQIPALLSWSPGDIKTFRDRVEGALDDVLAPWVSGYPDVEVTTLAVAERPADAVEDAAKSAQLVVLGRHTAAHRHGGFHLGSTTRGALHHAGAPVLVVPVPPPVKSHRSSDWDVGWAPMF